MKMTMKKLISTALLFTITFGIAQNKNNLWKKSNSNESSKQITKTDLPQKNLFELDVPTMKKLLSTSTKRENFNTASKLIITLPNGEGQLENFYVYENSIMAPELAAKYPEIKSYVAVGIENPNARAYFSYSPLGFNSMTLYPDQSAVFIEPISNDLTTYSVYKKSDKKKGFGKFECGVIDETIDAIQPANTNYNLRGADDAKLRTFRLALSCTAEYATYFGGTKAGALAAMNNSMTRINGVFEKDFGVKLILIANNDAIIYTNTATDPFSDPANYPNWGTENQNNLTTVIGASNYDIGHLFGLGTVGSGDAGCRGCVCNDTSKGRGYSRSNSATYRPDSDFYTIDIVAHEMAHQLGANHTFTHVNEGTIAQLEPGSGSTIMSYAGGTSKNVQNNKDAYFHAISIQQVTDNIKTKTCPIVISTGNAVPVVNSGMDYTIPKRTPFMLIGSATDENTNDLLTYSWEEMDLGTATTSVPSASATTGPLFRSYTPSTSPIRYFPNMNTILAGLTTTSGAQIPVEELPGVARTLNFRLTVRDNRIGGGANNADDMIITVNDVAGPFTVDSQNTTMTYAVGTTQVINWSVAGTDANGVNCAFVDILLSSDGGQTFPTVLVAGTPNDGTQNIVIPNIPGTTNRIMVKGTNHIFFDVNNANFTIIGNVNTDTTAPTVSILSASGTTTTSTNLSWTAATDNIGIAGYDVYQNGTLRTTTNATTLSVTGLNASTAYNFYVKAKDAAGNVSTASNTVNITTLTPADTTAPTTSTLSASGTTTSSTNLSWTIASDNIGVSGYDIYQNGAFRTSTINTSITITGLAASTVYNFYIKAKDAAGNVSTASNTVNITTLTPADTTAPTTSTLSASGTITSSTNLSWTTASDNIGVSGYDIYQNGVYITSTINTSITITGLAASTTYNFYVKAKDVAGNVSAASNIVTITTSSITSLVTTPTYCNSIGGTSREYINNVIVGTINNTSGNDNGYGNYTAMYTDLALGSTTKISITPTWIGASRAESYNVWIDFNKNGTFESTELVFTKSKSKTSSVSGSLTIPTNVLTGATRMRVSMKYNVLPTACETFSAGEVEDYTINITSAVTRNSEEVTIVESTKEEITKLDFKLYPNPVKGDTVNFTDIEDTTSYRIFNQMGQQVASGYIENNSVNVGTLMPAIYIIEVTDGKSVGTKRFIKE